VGLGSLARFRESEFAAAFPEVYIRVLMTADSAPGKIATSAKRATRQDRLVRWERRPNMNADDRALGSFLARLSVSPGPKRRPAFGLE
jgi:hypothetical protein